MLVLSRRLGETIVIDGDISITVVAIKGDRVRIGVTAPKTTTVDRQEVHELRSEFANGFAQPEVLDLGNRCNARRTGGVAASSGTL